MARIVWLTDIHLNFVTRSRLDDLVQQIHAEDPNSVLIGGDIGEADSVVGYLDQLAEQLQVPIYFVLGNHDFYRGSIRRVREAVRQLCQLKPRLVYLSQSEPERLGASTGLIGHDGWADGRIGDYERSLVMMNDYRLIEELAGFSKRDRLYQLHQLGDESARWIRQAMESALQEFAHVILLTHVPPMREACWYNGQLSDDEWAPHFACKAMGDTILSIMKNHPDKKLTVLCGHTHSPGEVSPLDNVSIITGGAEYERPRIVRAWNVD